jgi:hypothetical protein
MVGEASDDVAEETIYNIGGGISNTNKRCE